MKKLGFIFTLTFLIFGITYFASATKANSRETYVDNKALCERTKGNWRLFNNSCADTCESKFETTLCTYHPSFTCDCGENRCWDGGKCIAEKVIKAEFDEKAQKQKEAREEELKALGLLPDGSSPEQTATVQQPANPAPAATTTNPPAGANPLAPTNVNPTTPTSEDVTKKLQDEINAKIKESMQDPEIAKIMTEKQNSCETQGGKWIEFSNGCADTCGSKISGPNSICTQSLTFSCKCGEGQCWDGLKSSCTNLEDYKKNLIITP